MNQDPIQASGVSIDTFLWTCGTLIGILVLLIGFIVNHILGFNKEMNTKMVTSINEIKLELKEEVKEITIDQKEVNKEMKEIRENYLHRFDKLYKLISEGNVRTNESINQLRLEFVTAKNK